MSAAFRQWAEHWDEKAAVERAEMAVHYPDSFFYAQRNLRRAVFEFFATICRAAAGGETP